MGGQTDRPTNRQTDQMPNTHYLISRTMFLSMRCMQILLFGLWDSLVQRQGTECQLCEDNVIIFNDYVLIKSVYTAMIQNRTCFMFQGPSYETTQKIRRENLTPSMLTYYRKPVLIHQGHMQWLWDNEGRRYLDLFGGIVTVSVGHCHP